MAEYVVELYAPKGDESGVRDAAGRLISACDELTRDGHSVRHVRSILLPEEETSLSLCEADSAETVRRAVALAGLGSAHVSAAVAVPTGDRQRGHAL